MGIFDSIFGGIGNVVKSVFGAFTGGGDDSQKRMMNDQIKAYREQTEITKQEMARKKDEQVAEKRRIDEKQIRSLRRNYQSSGLLGSSQSSQPGTSTQLGG